MDDFQFHENNDQNEETLPIKHSLERDEYFEKLKNWLDDARLWHNKSGHPYGNVGVSNGSVNNQTQQPNTYATLAQINLWNENLQNTLTTEISECCKWKYLNSLYQTYIQSPQANIPPMKMALTFLVLESFDIIEKLQYGLGGHLQLLFSIPATPVATSLGGCYVIEIIDYIFTQTGSLHPLSPDFFSGNNQSNRWNPKFAILRKGCKGGGPVYCSMSGTDLEFFGFEAFQKNLENPEIAMPIAVELLTLELLHRLVVCAYEFCATPGKRYMGLIVVTAESFEPVPGRINESILLARHPRPLSWQNSIIRAASKNIFVGLFLPLCVAFYIFPYNRTSYDMMSNSIVVEYHHEFMVYNTAV
ncbi:hypothetical protein NQ317_002209 [Molorchus minor]|uniref:Uncharacterized protein n=1 Tax=Molorchus minor TaxID=1323400 RepID=A0ABQ9IZ94_9CUCU|nr:hypothetical protein NQ317_002209 [Molorchus minor]